ncbi:hypothetical protein KAJ83_00095 [Marivibrio halodurans]|uniref:Antitoxin SocA-like Panacea domain-containing protein n=1 Tax=Marivibrio halodurans TaxID=2039722 RepID=A0A8J7V250_9PROT|nr:hypothetical protein [Marivibrio halodurans]MBP5855394.1 hypothetical protein [Marivibrio halodurans]
MTVPAIPSTLDVALWLFDQSRREDIYMPAQKLQRLLWLQQGTYAAMNHGRMLMPATFVADETGPIEATVFHLFEDSRPPIPPRPIEAVAENHLARTWRRYAHHSPDYLTKPIVKQLSYREAWKRGPGSVIPFEAIARDFTQLPESETLVKAGDGRALRKWVPTAKPAMRRIR